MQSREEKVEQIEKKKRVETYDRLTAVAHFDVEHFSEHKKLEGYYEDRLIGHMFRCDRLMKMETMFGRLQMGYNPNRGRSFIFANLKTSRYDTVSSRYQKEMAEYQMKTLIKGQNQNRAYISKRSNMSSILLEKAEAKPWSEESVRPYYTRANSEALVKTMPFFNRTEERGQLEETRQKQKAIRDIVAQNAREGNHSENTAYQQEAVRQLEKENMLEAILYRKEAGSKFFLRKINCAFDIQKHEMFEYYKHRKNEIEAGADMTSITAGDEGEPDKDEK